MCDSLNGHNHKSYGIRCFSFWFLEKWEEESVFRDENERKTNKMRKKVPSDFFPKQMDFGLQIGNVRMVPCVYVVIINAYLPKPNVDLFFRM